jgi:DNA-directed RNA polymerase subunit alpha
MTTELASLTLSDLQLSVRPRKCMTRLGITTIEKLINTDAAKLLECKNFGRVSLKEVRERLAECGLKLKGE